MKKIVLVVLLLGVTALATNVFDWVKIRKPDGSPGLPMKYGSDTIVRPCTFLRDTNALNIYHGVDSGYFGIGHNGAKTTWLTSILQQDKDTLKSHSMTLSNRFGLGANFNFTVYQFDMPNGRMHVMDSGAGGWAIFAEESYYMGGGAIYGKAYSDIGVKGHFCGPGTPAYAVFGYCDSGGIAVGGIDTGWNEGIGGYFLGKKYGCQASGDTYDFYGEWKSYLDSLKTHIASAVLKAEADSDVVACALLADYAYNDSASRRINDSIARFADSLAAKLPLHGKADSAVLSDLSDSCTGGAVRAAKLTTARTIGGVSFDGTANIIPDTCKRSGTCAVADSAAKVKIPLHLYSASRDTLLSFDEVATNAHPQVLWKINTADTGTADFSMMYWPRNNPYGTQLDGIFYWGYNIGSNCGLNCGAQDITKPSGSMRIESNYRPGIGGQIMEIGFEVLKPDSQTAYRPFYILLNRITDSITVTQQASSYEWMAIQNAGDRYARLAYTGDRNAYMWFFDSTNTAVRKLNTIGYSILNDSSGHGLLAPKANPTFTGLVTVDSITGTKNKCAIDSPTSYLTTKVIRIPVKTTTALQIQDSAGTNFMNFDMTNRRLGIGTVAPTGTFHVSQASGDMTTRFQTGGNLSQVAVDAIADYSMYQGRKSNSTTWYIGRNGNTQMILNNIDDAIYFYPSNTYAATLGSTGFYVGPSITTPAGQLHTGKTSASNNLVIDCFSATTTHTNQLQFRKSSSATNNTWAQTVNGDVIGSLLFRAVNSTPALGYGAQIYVVQNGAAGATYIPVDMKLYTSSSTAENTNQVILANTGNVGVNTAVASISNKLTVTGGAKADTLISTAVSISTKDSCTGTGWFGGDVTVTHAAPVYLNINGTGTGLQGINLQSGETTTAVWTYNSGTGEIKYGGVQTYSYPTFYAGNALALTIATTRNATFEADVAADSLFANGKGINTTVGYYLNGAPWVPDSAANSSEAHHADTADKAPWAGIDATPTTLAGYGITDAAPLNHGVADNSIAKASGTSTTWTATGLTEPYANALNYTATAGAAEFNIFNSAQDSGLQIGFYGSYGYIKTYCHLSSIVIGNTAITCAPNGAVTLLDTLNAGNGVFSGNVSFDTAKGLTAKFTDLSPWYYPLHQSDALGLVDGHIKDSLGCMIFDVPDTGSLTIRKGGDTLMEYIPGEGAGINYGTVATTPVTVNMYGDLNVKNNGISGGTAVVDVELRVGGSSSQTNYDIVAPSIYADSCVNALVFTDRTPFYTGDALKELRKIKGKDGQIDHASLPDFTRVIKSHTDKKTKKTVIDTTRDLGATISMLTVAVQQLSAQVDSLKSLQAPAPHGMNGSASPWGLVGVAAVAVGVGATVLKKKK